MCINTSQFPPLSHRRYGSPGRNDSSPVTELRRTAAAGGVGWKWAQGNPQE
ncbi:mCG1035247 [Mus musculus]|nr:mCG1035247 [Mus musculus]